MIPESIQILRKELISLLHNAGVECIIVWNIDNEELILYVENKKDLTICKLCGIDNYSNKATIKLDPGTFQLHREWKEFLKL